MPYDENGNYINDEYSQIDYSPAANDPYRLIQTGQGDMTVEQALNWLRQRYAQMGLDDSYLPSDVYGIQTAIDQVGGTTPLKPAGYTPNAGANFMYQTRAGFKTLDQLQQELRAAGYNGPMDDPDAMVRAYNGADLAYQTGTAGAGAPGSTGSATTGNRGFNAAAANAANALAQQVAYQKYLDEKLRMLEIPQMQALTELERDRLAFQKAQQAYMETYNQARLDFERDSFEKDLALRRDQFGLSQQQLEEERRQFDASQAEQTRQFNLQYGLQQQQQQTQGALGLMNIASQLRGPADYFQYLQTLSGTPQGLRDLVSAVAGQYDIPGFGAGAPGVQNDPMTLGRLTQDIVGQSFGGVPAQAAGAAGQAGVPGAPTPAGPVMERYTGAGAPGGVQGAPRTTNYGTEHLVGIEERKRLASQAGADAALGPVFDRYIPQAGSGAPAQPGTAGAPANPYSFAAMDRVPAAIAAQGLGTTRQEIASNLTAPRNWSAKNIARMSPTQRSMLSGLYEYAQGKRPEDVEWEFRQSLPKVGGPAGGTFRF